MKNYLKGKHIIFGITGGIAAYKSAVLARLFVKAGAEVQVVMTPSAREFITPVTMSALTGRPVITEFFSANTGEWHSHVDIGLWADAMVIAPATACTIGKMANGIADNMLITTYLSAKEQVMVCPAMDLDMWAHASTQRNVRRLCEDGVIIVEPAGGELASGLVGKGRMAEPDDIVREVERYFGTLERKRDLEGMKVMITAGPTYENIDPVRFIGNYSSGKMGYTLARECRDRGAEVVLVSGPVSLEQPEGVKTVGVTSAVEMLEACERHCVDADIMIMAAAVADYAPVQVAESKIKREGVEEMTLTLRRNPDIAQAMGLYKDECDKKPYLVGFALETDNEFANAEGKMKKKNLDMIVLNSLRDPEAGFMKDTNKVTIFTHGGENPFPAKTKPEVARDIVDAIVGEMGL